MGYFTTSVATPTPAAIGLIVRDGVHATAPQSGPMTDEQKAERKALIENNKEWDAAETVRRDWLTQFLARKALPKDAALIVATLLTAARREVAEAMTHGNDLAAQLLGIQTGTDYWTDRFADYLTAHLGEALYVSLAVALAGVEKSTSRDTWRNPKPEKARYLQTLQAWGYPPVPRREDRRHDRDRHHTRRVMSAGSGPTNRSDSPTTPF